MIHNTAIAEFMEKFEERKHLMYGVSQKLTYAAKKIYISDSLIN